MQGIRPPAVAGTFYSDDPVELKKQLSDYLKLDNGATHQLKGLKALIVPHAGYIYSAPIAASAYQLLTDKTAFNNVVLIGPSHVVPFKGIAGSSATYFSTPLGKIPLDTIKLKELEQLGFTKQYDPAHALEHSLEVQLPFLQTTLKNFTLIPLVVGEASIEQVFEVLGFLWGDSRTLIVISTDLSHYQDYETAQYLDNATNQAILGLAPSNISYENACGRTPLNALLRLAKLKELKVKLLDLKNSGDTSGNKERVVGYGSWALVDPNAE